MSGASNRLLMDAGNSRIKFVIYDGNGFGQRGTIESPEQLQSLMGDIDACWLSSVGQSSLVDTLICCLQNAGIATHQLISQAQYGSLINGYSEPAQLGVDRWLAMLACRQMHLGNFTIIDFGTAITCDFVSAEGHHQGGWIMPGYRTMKRSLQQTTELNMPHDNAVQDCAPGLNTADGINRGCLATLYGCVEMAENYWRQRQQDYKIFICGGDGGRLEFNSNSRIVAVEDGVFLGIKHLIDTGYGE